jgi:hypothetical protein
MSTKHDEWFEPPLAEGLAENDRGEVADIAIGFLTFVGLILVLVGVWSAFALGAVYLCSHVADQLGQFFGT